LTFSYGRALQNVALRTWAGRRENFPQAQAAFTHRARMNSLAALGQWTSEQDRLAA
jgi:fructose-bisphosphate aldolase class I